MTAEWRRGVSLAVVGLVIGLGLIGAVATATRAVLQGAAPEPVSQTGAIPAALPVRSAEPGPAPVVAEPRFDVIRVEPDGAAVVAGRAAPNAEIELLVGGQPFARGRTDADGHFALVPPPFPAGSSEVTLRSTAATASPPPAPTARRWWWPPTGARRPWSRSAAPASRRSCCRAPTRPPRPPPRRRCGW